jgi:lipopolysaccharide export system permease protein
MGWTLNRYFFFRYVAITAWYFFGISALILIINFTELSSRTDGIKEFTIGLILAISAMRVPMVMQQIVPFIALFAAMTMLVTLNRKYELVIARSVGLSAWQFLAPVCFGALVFGGLAITLLNPVAANGYARAESIEALLRSGKSNAISANDAPWIRQSTAQGDTFIGAHAILNQGLELVDAVFLRLDKGGDIVERLDARHAYLRAGYWELVDVQRIREDATPEKLDRARVDTSLTPEFVQERLSRPETIPFFQLPRAIQAARSFGLKANAFAMQFHSLVALPLLLVAMTLIAATVSMRFARMGQSATMILGGVAAGFLLYVVSVLVKAFGVAGFVPPPVAAWLPVVVAMFFGVTFLLYKEDG